MDFGVETYFLPRIVRNFDPYLYSQIRSTKKETNKIANECKKIGKQNYLFRFFLPFRKDIFMLSYSLRFKTKIIIKLK